MLSFKKVRNKTSPLMYISIFIMSFIMVSGCFAKDMNYKVTVRSDGGYSLEIDITKMNLFSADGFFQKVKNHYVINLIGKGKDWSYRNQKGFYYGQNEILSNTSGWDFGYAWVNDDRTYLYLNLYWVASPDGIIPSDVNGKYSLTKE